ncbi:MAG: hypothetical protein QG612_3094, partial [Pseudomonadota bacterium]|nr:hypothetical protein [Pseudomonadota bacterium]
MPSTPLRSPPGSASTGSIRSIDPAAPAAAMPAAGWTMETLAAFLQAPRGTDPLRALVVHLAASLRCDRA